MTVGASPAYGMKIERGLDLQIRIGSMKSWSIVKIVYLDVVLIEFSNQGRGLIIFLEFAEWVLTDASVMINNK